MLRATGCIYNLPDIRVSLWPSMAAAPPACPPARSPARHLSKSLRYILTTDQSDAGSVGIFSRRTNRMQEA
eukprot:5282713-Pyramimonas_sp.AAC.1